MKIAVVGTGISALSAAWGLKDRAELVFYDRRSRLGGHTATVDIDYDGKPLSVDTGFIVYNTLNYPNLTAFFDLLGVKTEWSNMSFAVSTGGRKLEWSGDGLGSLFAQKRNFFSPSFLWMLREIMRFNTKSHQDRKAGKTAGLSLGDYLSKRKFSKKFAEQYLVPMGAAIWSTPRSKMLEFPAESFIRFFENHRLINWNRPEWRTVSGGSRSYHTKMLEKIGGEVRGGCAVTRIERKAGRVDVTDDTGRTETYDHVIIGAHSDQALAMLADPSDKEQRLLGDIQYRPNTVYLHRDPALMPQRKKVWASWNYMEDKRPDDHSDVWVSYWMNRLQNISDDYPVFVTLNPPRPPAPELTFGIYEYDHPQFDKPALEAQKALPALQGERNTWYCGAYHGYGFHEDGMVSGIKVGEALGGHYEWRGDQNA
ncbi:MAG: FAD-dependent oxidoreductase, partial [Pseudomonadota bacterium]